MMAAGSTILFVVLLLVFVVAAPILVGIAVYRDAKARGMEPWLWTLVSVLVPYFIGLIIYLIVRASHKALQCANCGAQVEPAFSVCSQCGGALKYKCEACGAPVDAQWKACTQCGAQLPQGRPPLTQSMNAQTNKPFWILLAILGGLVLLVLLAVLGFSFSATAAVASQIIGG